MSLSFFPKVVKFFELFEKQNTLLRQSVEILHSLFHDFDQVADKCRKIHLLEAEANSLGREISRQLSLTFITPLDREDIYQINTATEDAVNSIKAISTRLGLYKFSALKPASIELVHCLFQMVQQTSVMLENLSKKKEVEAFSAKLQELAGQSEMLLTVALGEIYEEEKQDAEGMLEVVKWTQIYDRIEQSIQKVSFLANILEGVSIKNA